MCYVVVFLLSCIWAIRDAQFNISHTSQEYHFAGKLNETGRAPLLQKNASCEKLGTNIWVPETATSRRGTNTQGRRQQQQQNPTKIPGGGHNEVTKQSTQFATKCSRLQDHHRTVLLWWLDLRKLETLLRQCVCDFHLQSFSPCSCVVLSLFYV